MLRDTGRRLALLAPQWYSSERLAWVLIGLGVLLRLAQYTANRSLWNDEALIALNIINRPLAGLLQPLDFDQGAPVGFLIAAKLAVQVLGSGEYALRLVPLISGILSVFLFFAVARRSISPGAAPVALGLFAVLGPLIYYSSEVKQYSSDVAIALIVFFSVRAVGESGGLSVSRVLTLGLIGAISLWCSHPSLFVLMGVGATAVMGFWRDRDWGAIGRFSIVALIWTLSLVLLYYVSLRHLRTNQYLLDFWGNAFLPFPHARDSLSWLWRTFLRIFDWPVGLPYLPGIAAFVCLVGAASLWTENRITFLALTLPLFFTLAASAFRLYPFDGRLLLFAVPFIVLLIATGVERTVAATKVHSPMIGILLAGLLLFPPMGAAGSHLLKPQTNEEIKPVMAYLKMHKEPGDTLYLFGDCHRCEKARYAVPAFTYYSERYGLAPDSYVDGTIVLGNDWEKYIPDLDRLRGTRRAWILFSHLPDDARDFFLHYLDTKGTRLDSFVSVGNPAVYLYDLGKKNDGS